jgi:hypothetical protein
MGYLPNLGGAAQGVGARKPLRRSHFPHLPYLPYLLGGIRRQRRWPPPGVGERPRLSRGRVLAARPTRVGGKNEC